MALHLAEKKYSTQKSFHAINDIKAVDSIKYSKKSISFLPLSILWLTAR